MGCGDGCSHRVALYTLGKKHKNIRCYGRLGCDINQFVRAYYVQFGGTLLYFPQNS